jgi:chromosome partitioning protein
MRRSFSGAAIIDGPPWVIDLVRSVVMTSDVLVIPLKPSPFDVWASDEIRAHRAGIDRI